MLPVEIRNPPICYLAPADQKGNSMPPNVRGRDAPFENWLEPPDPRSEIAGGSLTAKDWEFWILIELRSKAIVDFANVDQSGSAIEQFTKSYGSLDGANDFPTTHTISEWRRKSEEFRETWNLLLESSFRRHLEFPKSLTPVEFASSNLTPHAPKNGLNVEMRWPDESVCEVGPASSRIWPRAEGNLTWTDKGLVFIGNSLYAALLAKLFSIAQSGSLRRCPNPTCAVTPYFVADAERRKFCSQECSDAAKRRSKRIWWEDKGNERRKSVRKAADFSAEEQVHSIPEERTDGVDEAR